MVCKFDEGMADRGVPLVRRILRAGNVEGMGLRDDRFGRRVELRSRLLRAGKRIKFGGDESRLLSGLSRSKRVAKFGRVLRGAISSRVSKLLDDKLSTVSKLAFRGLVTLERLFAEMERDFIDGKAEVRDAMSSQESRVFSRAKCSMLWKGLASSPGTTFNSVSRNLLPLQRSEVS